MLFQPSNIYPSTFSGIGAGTVDVTQGLNVSWQVNGDTPMTAYRIKIYQNDSSSTLMYDSGSLAVTPAFEPHDKYGNPTFFQTQIAASALSTAGIVNGYQYGYKMLITQYWGVSDYVEQTSASVFITRSNPSLTIDAIPTPVTSSSITITATYSQAQGDPISTVEWVFAQAGSESTPIKETGSISTQILSFDADGLITGNTYSIMCNVVTANGVYASTGFVQFSVSYASSSISINYQLAQLKNSSAVYLSWDPISTPGVTGISVYCLLQGSQVLRKVYDLAANGTAILDYYTPSQGQISYLIVVHTSVNDLFCSTNSFTPTFWFYSILLCDKDNDGVYHVSKEYIFKYGVESGTVSNNNDPTIQKNFTPYPNRQPISSLYKTGKLTSYIGKTNSQNQYSDSVSLQNAIYDISTSPLTKFLKTRKGDVLMVDTAAAIQMKTEDATTQQALRATVDWVEVGDASNKSIVSVPTDSFWPIQ